MSELVFEPGKFYKTRGGNRVRIYAVQDFTDVAFVGAIEISGALVPMGWRGNRTSITNGVIGGKAYGGKDPDLVSLWFDPPVVNWDEIPPGVLSVARHPDGRLLGFLRTDKRPSEKGWRSEGMDYEAIDTIGLPTLLMKFEGDWRDSLAIRPGYEGMQ